MLRQLAHVLLTLWAGGLWTTCGVVAPTLFAVLGQQTAGSVVGHFFGIAAWAGLLIGLVLFALTRTPTWAAHRSLGPLILVSAAAPMVSELALGPMMRQARMAGDLQTFAILHSIGGLLFLAACVGTLVLVWKVNRAA